MGNPLAGFVAGFANNQVDQIQERRKLENEEKKARMLAQLQSETSRANFLFEEGYKKSNDVDKSMSTTDYETGKVTLRSRDGTELGSRDINKSERDEYQAGLTKTSLDNENVRSTIDERRNSSRRADAEAGRSAAESTARIGSYNRSNRGGSLDGSDSTKPMGTVERLQEMQYKNKAQIDAAIAAGVPYEEIVSAASESLTQAKTRAQGKPTKGIPDPMKFWTPERAELTFIDALNAKMKAKR